MKFMNPVIPGFYPDPSVCRAGEDYYLVNSSFEFFPGVPLWHSRDLLNWEQTGYVLTRRSQLELAGTGTSGGIFAPTIRFHGGRFYMITTNMNPAVCEKVTYNFIVHTDDIRGEWSDPVPVDHEGIDPSLFWDEDGRCYFQGTHFTEKGQCIGQFEINPDTGERLSETKPIWYGTGGRCPEGPHMYRIGGTYYLMIAEGGTEYGHTEVIARSDSVWGPFESCPANPVLTNRNVNPSFAEMSRPDYQEIGCVGHADLVDDPDGSWWVVFHGVRPSRSQLHHIGRETMLAQVDWKDGWPVMNGGKAVTPVSEARDIRGAEISADGFAKQYDFRFAEDFTEESVLPARWAYLRNPAGGSCAFDQGLVLTANEDTLEGYGAPAFAGVRQCSMAAAVETVIDFTPAEERAEAGITVFHTNEHHYDLILTKRDGKRAAILRRRAADLAAETPPVHVLEGPLSLRIECSRQEYVFFAGDTEIGRGRTQLLSTEVMAGTFTGCFFGVFCQGMPGEEARFLSFSVR